MISTLPKHLTLHDLLKTLALILMIVDHLGHHFYPDDMWFRVFGRLCVPIWFYLIGFANTARIDRKLWIGAIMVAASAIVAGQYVLPLNILFTIMLIRYLRHWLILSSFHSVQALRGIFFILFFLYFPTALFFEYGTLGMMLALCGFAVRHRDFVRDRVEDKYILLFYVAVFFSYYMLQAIAMPSLSVNQAIVMSSGVGIIGLGLWFFRPITIENARRHMAGSLISVLQFTGRRTLEIYVLHIILFRLIAMFYQFDGYGLMAWQIAPSEVLLLMGIR